MGTIKKIKLDNTSASASTAETDAEKDIPKKFVTVYYNGSPVTIRKEELIFWKELSDRDKKIMAFEVKRGLKKKTLMKLNINGEEYIFKS